jgi:hypothetical protein
MAAALLASTVVVATPVAADPAVPTYSSCSDVVGNLVANCGFESYSDVRAGVNQLDGRDR